MLNLDTQVHALAGELTRPEETLLRDDAWSISAIVLWEIGKLGELGRIVRSDPADEIIIAAASLVYQVPLVTRDAWWRRSRLVPLATPRRG